jgi:hypothetical protein
MRDFETCLESTDDNLGIWNLEEMVRIEPGRTYGRTSAPASSSAWSFVRASTFTSTSAVRASD